MRFERKLWAGGLALALVAGCSGGAGGGRGTTPGSIRIPNVVDDASYAAAVRTYHSLDLDDSARPRLRDRIVTYLTRQGTADIETRDYDAVVARLAKITDLYSPEDFAEERVPRTL